MNKIPNEVAIRSSHYLLGGLSIVAALGWNETIKKYIAKVYTAGDGASASLIYALTMTIFLVIMLMILPNTEKLLPQKTRELLSTKKEK